MVKAGLILGLLGGTHKYVNDKVKLMAENCTSPQETVSNLL